MNQPRILAFTGYQKFLIAILALLQFTVILDFMVLSPLGDILMKTLNMTPSGFGLVVSSYAFSAGASGILAAGFADKYDRKKLLLFFYVGFIAGTFFCAMANSFEMLLAARIITGLFGGVIGSISMAIVADLFAINQRGRVMGFIQMAFAASQVLGIPIGLYFANLWGWHAVFLMIVLLAILIGIAVLLRMQPVTKHLALQSDDNAFRHLWNALANKTYQTGYLAVAFLSIGGFMLMPFGSAYLINNIHLQQAQLPLIFLVSGLSSIIIMPVIGRLSDRVNKFWLFTGGSMLAIVMVIIYTNIPPIPLWEVAVINVIMFMGIMSRMIPANILSSGLPDMKDRGAYMSITSSLQQMAGGVAAVGAGLIVTQAGKSSPLAHYNVLGYVVSIAFLACIYFVYRMNELVTKRSREASIVVSTEPADSPPLVITD
ncbi:MFS transporter [Fibrella forsythiae]|uniref:MFS transporter n=1 Tax=Fibrella forsythiae TaxID=2817061 RepID=A0ABS3JFQ5_9BACT|nr:MFS transporter [Fibrella forsythiae]MBO0948119.1 MFS transporter [Fibrella forsythiae]